MTSNALYFPYINVPDDDWTMRVLLYWDKLSSIVPTEFTSNPDQLRPHMRDLVSSGLVEKIHPASYIYMVEDFEGLFIKYVEKRLPRMKYTLHRKQPDRIHVEKLHGLADWLVEKDLGARVDYSWLEVEHWVAKAFMTYLATILGAIREVNATPITYDPSITMYSPATRNSKTQIRESLLSHLLPVPAKSMTIGSLLRFKEKHQNLLPSFRKKIEHLCSRIESSENEQVHDRLLQQAKDDLESDVRTIEESMKVKWGKTIFGTFTPLFGTAATVCLTPMDDTSNLLLSSMSLVGVSCNAISNIRSEVKTRHNNPLAYLAYARRFRGK